MDARWKSSRGELAPASISWPTSVLRGGEDAVEGGVDFFEGLEFPGGGEHWRRWNRRRLFWRLDHFGPDRFPAERRSRC